MDLMDFVRDAMFEAVVRQLFGHDNVPQEKVCVWVIVLRAAGLRAYCIRICTVNKINLLCFKGAVARKRKQFKFELHNEGVSETIVRAMCMRNVYAHCTRIRSSSSLK